jgi:heme/copper-type cytochrome/quinol oxidase subunit 1
MFTMHGTTMIFLAVMPLSAAFFNFIMPLQIGARDVAFPRLNAFSLWTFVAGAMGQAAELYSQVQRTVGASQRIRELLREPAEIIVGQRGFLIES